MLLIVCLLRLAGCISEQSEDQDQIDNFNTKWINHRRKDAETLTWQAIGETTVVWRY